MNVIHTIHPRVENGALVFDDIEKGLTREPFVSGADDILISAAVRAGHNPDHGFPLHFSDSPIPSAIEAERVDGEAVPAGAWYHVAAWDMSGWLCPATLRYFSGGYPSKIWFIIPTKKEPSHGT